MNFRRRQELQVSRKKMTEEISFCSVLFAQIVFGAYAGAPAEAGVE
jgi:hypothetical protein